MGRLSAAACVAVFGFGGVLGWAQAPADSAEGSTAITLAAGTKVELVVTEPVWAASAKSGDPLYMQTNFPVVAGGQIAIPAGSWVQGTIEGISKPTRRQSRAQLQVLFTTVIFADGYAVTLPGADPSQPVSASSSAMTAATVTVEVSTANDLLLDNGAQVEMTLGAPLALDAAEVAKAIPLTHAPAPGQFKSATRCRPTPGDSGTPGTPDTVIPGSPGTPSTTIPGGPGMPDITIPGTPATPATVIPGIPGTPATPGTSCPRPPIVTSSTPATLNLTGKGIAATPH
jgi:hypothetical protein